ncbi:SET domain-containing protein [Candidatus Kaiserbacteria bacterium]|nr:SET domain-containing protein [Candidatus Kaiserbacteria bacterium]
MGETMGNFLVKDSGLGTGKGLFAARDFKKREYLLDYTGIKIATKVADTLSSRYLFEINSRWTIDGEPSSNTARWINHACEPNVEAEIEGGRIKIYAIRNITKGEEFAIDYGDEYFDEFIKPVGCKCGATKHRA